MGINGDVTDDVTGPQRCCEAIRSAILATAWFWFLVFNNLHSASIVINSLVLPIGETTHKWAERPILSRKFRLMPTALVHCTHYIARTNACANMTKPAVSLAYVL